MEDVSQRSLGTRFLGRDYDLPFGVAPMGMCNLVWPGADKLIAEAARIHNIPVCLSSAASSSIEDMRNWTGANAWFQLYVGQSIDSSLEMVERAKRAGYETLILTVDVPQVSRRPRDQRNGFDVPFRIGPKQFLDFATHPIWSLTSLLHGVPKPQNFVSEDGNAKFERGASRAGADWRFLDRLREIWPHHLIVKGVMSADDALRIQRSGADAIYVSNHGGRQLDSAPSAISVISEIRTAVGRNFPLIFDSGIRGGEDVIKALASGADFVMLGRPILYALGAEARVGLNSLIRIFAEDMSVAMAQIGVFSVDDINENVLHVPSVTTGERPNTSLQIASKQA